MTEDDFSDDEDFDEEEDLEEDNEELDIQRVFQDYVDQDSVILIIDGQAKVIKCSGSDHAKILTKALLER